MQEVFIGIDLAWGEKNPSGFSVLTPSKDNKLDILESKLIYSVDELLLHIQKYKDCKVYVAVDAPLEILNEDGNREIEKEFNKDFSKYKISMLPVNRKIMTKYSAKIRSEVFFYALQELGFQRDYQAQKVVFEVYTHSTIAVCFNNYTILPYKKKQGRTLQFVKEQLAILQNYLQSVTYAHQVYEVNIELLKGKSLKEYEDKLDALVCAYGIFYCKSNNHKLYKQNGIETFLTPV